MPIKVKNKIYDLNITQSAFAPPKFTGIVLPVGTVKAKQCHPVKFLRRAVQS